MHGRFWNAARPRVAFSEAVAVDSPDLLEDAVIRTIRNAGAAGVECIDDRSRFLVGAFGDPAEVIEAVFRAVDWDAVSARLTHQSTDQGKAA
jgi:hypothetical protein